MIRQDLEGQRKYWNNTLEDFDSIYSGKRSAFGRWVDRTFRWDMYKRFEYTFEHSEPIEGKTILDVGSGTGRFTIEYARRKAARAVGIDISEEMVKVSKERAQHEGFENICEFYQSDLLDYNPDSQFDICIGIGLFDYIKDAYPVIEKMAQVTSDRAIMSFPRKGTFRAAIRKLRLGLRGCPVYFYSEGQIRDYLKRAGFGNVEMEVVGQLYCVTAGK
jgi:ubiquinone/menaquinone biosynthesis C-methylase UbiE